MAESFDMKLEKTEIWITCERPLEGDARFSAGRCDVLTEANTLYHVDDSAEYIWKFL